MRLTFKFLFVALAICAIGLALLALAIRAMSWPARAHPDIAAVGVPVESVTLASRSGAQLAAWFAAGRRGTGGVVLMHGVRANRQHMAARMRFLITQGFSVLAFDFQAHGESSGTHITFGDLERHDARAAVAWMRARMRGEKIGAIGISMGGAAALLGDNPLDVDALVVEAVYPDIVRAIDGRIGAFIGPLKHAATPVFLHLGTLTTGLDPVRLRPIDGVKRFAGPLLVVSGTLDRYAPIAETREIFAAAVHEKQLWEVSGAGHVDLHAFARGAYEERIGQFLAQHLRQSSAP